MKIVPVILSGGSGQRLWPLSRELYPKQFLPLISAKTMAQETAARVADVFEPPLVVCNTEHRFIIAEQLRVDGVTPQAIILEERGRNTAPAVAVSALRIAEQDPDALMLILPADHVIRAPDEFIKTVRNAAAVAAQGKFVTLGITPEYPETAYGYIKRGAALEGVDGLFAVDQFVEKPDKPTAQTYLDDGGYFWNSGMFLFPVGAVLAELEKFQPEVVAACKKALAQGRQDLDFFRLDAEAFDACPSISVDYALMEKTENAVVAPSDFGWNDIGSWSALYEELAAKSGDEDGNVSLGDVMTLDVKGSLIHSRDMFTAVIGLENVVVVVTDDAVLVSDRDRAQDVKEIVARLKQAGRSEPVHHTRVYRPWGYYQAIHGGDRFQVKRLTVYPGEKLSLQKHFHRSEHWVVVSGTAKVTRDDETVLLKENESTYLPLGCKHRLENPGRIPLDLIEVQSGDYLGEDDIVRFEDNYGRP